ncbi:MAG: hypothetical protein PHI18_02615 [bacterium]|nr:hypothetical protein [bacterium]
MRRAILTVILIILSRVSGVFAQAPDLDSLMNACWARIADIQAHEHEIPEFAVPIDTSASFAELGNQAQAALDHLKIAEADLAADTAVLNNHFDIVAFTLHNYLLDLRVLLAQQRLEYQFLNLKCHPADSSAWQEFDKARLELEHLARTATISD